ncbi:MAG: hypothetical protein LBI47_02395 [Puniceicoccales bacterium]|jgi:hypothetical protein|nr:hypothetical protein [Puniceicoccales bacterium]
MPYGVFCDVENSRLDMDVLKIGSGAVGVDIPPLVGGEAGGFLPRGITTLADGTNYVDHVGLSIRQDRDKWMTSSIRLFTSLLRLSAAPFKHWQKIRQPAITAVKNFLLSILNPFFRGTLFLSHR